MYCRSAPSMSIIVGPRKIIIANLGTRQLKNVFFFIVIVSSLALKDPRMYIPPIKVLY